jgi:hypothetical protein
VRIVTTKAGEDPAKAQLSYPLAHRRRQLIHIFWQETAAHPKAHLNLLTVFQQDYPLIHRFEIAIGFQL